MKWTNAMQKQGEVSQNNWWQVFKVQKMNVNILQLKKFWTTVLQMPILDFNILCCLLHKDSWWNNRSDIFRKNDLIWQRNTHRPPLLTKVTWIDCHDLCQCRWQGWMGSTAQEKPSHKHTYPTFTQLLSIKSWRGFKWFKAINSPSKNIAILNTTAWNLSNLPAILAEDQY